MRHVVTASLLVAAVIHLLPVVGVVGMDRLARLYGPLTADPTLEILLRHRAVLFGLVGAFLAYAVFEPRLQVAAVVAGFVSFGSFVWLARAIGDYHPAISRVIAFDVVALAALALCAASQAWAERAG